MLSKPKSSSQSNFCSASTSGSQLVVVHTKHGSQTSIVTNASNKSKGNGASTASKTQHGSQNTASDGQTSSLTTSAAHGFPKQNKTGFRFSLRRILYNSPLVTQRRARSLPTSSSNTLSHATKRQRKSLSKLECESPSESSGSTQHDAASSSASETRSSHTFSKGALDTDILECPLCLAQVPRHLYPDLLNCAHHSCLECMQQYMRIEISESRVDITCPQCSELVHPNDIRSILSNRALVEKYEGFMLRRVLVADPDCRWCPAPDCTFAVIASGCASCPKIRCGRPGCSSYFCYHCKAEWHPNQTCDAARAERTPHLRGSSATFSQESNSRDDLKACPRCQVLIVKMNDGSCNHMTCAVCGAEFCWLCMKEISDLHYLSPSGCTFWGTKPWSRKKKILWQLGTLVGAPVGIALMAGIALPAITIGVPVWVGRKLHTRYKTINKHKRNLIITSGVTASVLVSPVLAGLAVGIGVPILLAYVYGVVPISLCRSGGCGVSTSASGVRIDFDENETLDNKNQDGLSVDLTGTGRTGNPSIGEVSVSMGSGSHSHLDRGPESDREDCDGASQMGLAGSIASQRLEVQAEVVGRRLSSASEMASAHVSLPTELDDACASTRGLAGSIYSYKMADRDTCSVQSYKSGSQGDKCVTHQAAEGGDGYTPVEVHVQDSLTYQQYAYPGHVSLSPVSSFSLSGDELSLGPSSSVVRRSARRAKFFVDRQISDNSSLVSVEETGTDHVRFDDNVSYIDHDLALEDAPYQTPPESFEGQQPERALPHTVILISSGQESPGKGFVLAPVDAKRDRGTS